MPDEIEARLRVGSTSGARDFFARGRVAAEAVSAAFRLALDAERNGQLTFPPEGE
jgi:hypothetical protein